MLKRLKVIIYIYIYIYMKEVKKIVREKKKKRNCAWSQSDVVATHSEITRSNAHPIRREQKKLGVNINFELFCYPSQSFNLDYVHTNSLSHIWSSISASKTLQFPSKKKKLKWMCWRPLVGSRNHTQYPKTWCSFPS